MIENILTAVSHFISQTISHTGYLGVFLLMTLQSAAIPLPSEVIMPFAGSLVAAGRFSLPLLALIGALGSVAGSTLTYALGFYGGRPLIRQYGKYILLSERDLILTEKFFSRFGRWSALVGSVLPIVRTFISIPAGIGRVSYRSFVIFYFFGSFIWSFFLAWLGMKLGEHWSSLELYFRKFDILIAAAIVLAFAFWFYRHFRRLT